VVNPNRRPKQLSLGQVASDLKALREGHDRLKATVGKLKDILQTQDNWHAHVSRWIGKEVCVWSDEKLYLGKLKWTDRYNLGLELEDNLVIFNKGHISRLHLA